MATYNPTSVIALDTSTGLSTGTKFFYAVANGAGYTREWQRYFSSQPLPFGTGRITGIDNGAGINQYSITIWVTTWSSGSQPFLAGVTQTWDVQKTNLENSFKKIATPLFFLDPFGQPPDLDTTKGVYFWRFTETILQWSTPTNPFIEYNIVLTQTPPGTIV